MAAMEAEHPHRSVKPGQHQCKPGLSLKNIIHISIFIRNSQRAVRRQDNHQTSMNIMKGMQHKIKNSKERIVLCLPGCQPDFNLYIPQKEGSKKILLSLYHD